MVNLTFGGLNGPIWETPMPVGHVRHELEGIWFDIIPSKPLNQRKIDELIIELFGQTLV